MMRQFGAVAAQAAASCRLARCGSRSLTRTWRALTEHVNSESVDRSQHVELLRYQKHPPPFRRRLKRRRFGVESEIAIVRQGNDVY